MTTARPQTSPGFVGWVSDLARMQTRALSRIARAEGLSPEDALDAVQEAFYTFLNLPAATTLVGDDRIRGASCRPSSATSRATCAAARSVVSRTTSSATVWKLPRMFLALTNCWLEPRTSSG